MWFPLLLSVLAVSVARADTITDGPTKVLPAVGWESSALDTVSAISLTRFSRLNFPRLGERGCAARGRSDLRYPSSDLRLLRGSLARISTTVLFAPRIARLQRCRRDNLHLFVTDSRVHAVYDLVAAAALLFSRVHAAAPLCSYPRCSRGSGRQT